MFNLFWYLKFPLYLGCAKESEVLLKNQLISFNSEGSLGLQRFLRKITLSYSLNLLYIYQAQCSQSCATNTFFTHWLINYLGESAFSFKSSQHKSQTVKARKLNFWENDHPPPCVTCLVSGFMCHVSLLRCHNIYKYIYFFGQRSEASWWKGPLSKRPAPSSFPTCNELIGYPYNSNGLWLTYIYDWREIPIVMLFYENYSESVLLYLIKMVFPASLFSHTNH